VLSSARITYILRTSRYFSLVGSQSGSAMPCLQRATKSYKCNADGFFRDSRGKTGLCLAKIQSARKIRGLQTLRSKELCRVTQCLSSSGVSSGALVHFSDPGLIGDRNATKRDSASAGRILDREKRRRTEILPAPAAKKGHFYWHRRRFGADGPPATVGSVRDYVRTDDYLSR
jgi:hypothetical protein